MACALCFQISPPNEHITLTSPWYPWWQRYQPTGYNLCSRSGNENELRDMITRCNNVGVKQNKTTYCRIAFECFFVSYQGPR